MRAGLIAGLLALVPVSAFAQVNVRALSVVPATAGVAGQPIEVVASFQSDDVQPMPAFRWRVLLTLDGALDGAIPFGTIGPITLAGDQPQVFSVMRTLPGNVSGHFTVALVADFDGAVAESNEYDNVAIAPATTHVVARAADLEITGGGASATALRTGEPIDVSFSAQNLGELPATVTVGAYLSRDTVVTPSDRLIATTDVTIAAGATTGGVISGLVPAGTPAGDYVVGVIADPAGLVVEPDEANNIFQTARLNVFEDTLSLLSESIPNGTLTIDYHVQLVASGGDGHYVYTLVDGELPNGLRLAEDGTLEGTPSRTGTYQFEVEVESNGLTDRQAYATEIVSTFQPLRIVTDSIDGGFHRYPYQQVLVAGGGEPPYRWTITEDGGLLPPGLDLSTSGVISGIPNQLGTFGFGVTVQDRLGAIDSLYYEVEVTPLATVLILATESPVGFAGEPMDYAFQATGGIQPYRWEAASTPPPGLTVTEDGRLFGTPERVGLWPMRVRVTDSTTNGVFDTALFQIDIQDNSDFAIVTTSLPVALIRSKYEVVLEATGGDLPYTWSLGPGETLPDGFFLTPEGSIVGRAFRPFVHGFSLVVEDARGRTRQLPYAITVDTGNGGTFESGCASVAPSDGGAAFLLLGLLFFLRRKK